MCKTNGATKKKRKPRKKHKTFRHTPLCGSFIAPPSQLLSLVQSQRQGFSLGLEHDILRRHLFPQTQQTYQHTIFGTDRLKLIGRFRMRHASCTPSPLHLSLLVPPRTWYLSSSIAASGSSTSPWITISFPPLAVSDTDAPHANSLPIALAASFNFSSDAASSTHRAAGNGCVGWENKSTCAHNRAPFIQKPASTDAFASAVGPRPSPHSTCRPAPPRPAPG